MNKEQFDQLTGEKRNDILIKWFGRQQLFYAMINTVEGYEHLLREVKE